MEQITRFLEDIHRIALALDRLADLKRDGKVALPQINLETPEQTAPTPEAVPTVEPPATPAQEAAPTVDDKARRDFLKAELTRLGVRFAPTARTTTLETMLRGAEKREEPKTETIVEIPVAVPMAEAVAQIAAGVPSEVTKDDAKLALIAVSEKFGKDAAFELMDKVGGSRKLSEWDPANYAPLVAACKARQ
jgi:hypothetical protein